MTQLEQFNRIVQDFIDAEPVWTPDVHIDPIQGPIMTTNGLVAFCHWAVKAKRCTQAQANGFREYMRQQEPIRKAQN